jgi:hypothetical protein
VYCGQVFLTKSLLWETITDNTFSEQQQRLAYVVVSGLYVAINAAVYAEHLGKNEVRYT